MVKSLFPSGCPTERWNQDCGILLRTPLIARHPCGTWKKLLPLLPSGPGGFYSLPLRKTQLSTPSAMFRAAYESLGKAIIHPTDTKSNQQKVFRRGLKNNGGEGGI